MNPVGPCTPTAPPTVAPTPTQVAPLEPTVEVLPSATPAPTNTPAPTETVAPTNTVVVTPQQLSEEIQRITATPRPATHQATIAPTPEIVWVLPETGGGLPLPLCAFVATLILVVGLLVNRASRHTR